ncbi:MAG: hypothetical protein KAS32_12910 [Candidatus Peribacteraceae bacterium]|nr:hypothetical protein [Candidatus Peribacteraceae bacterium]
MGLSEIDIANARNYAIKQHGNQKYGGNPYVEHLDGVSEVLERFGYTKEIYPYLHVIAYLHDTIEDTKVDIFEFVMEFTAMIYTFVWTLSQESGKNRKERFAKTYPKTRLMLVSVVVKVADRISNTEQCILKRPDLLKMYKREFGEFERELNVHDDEGLLTMWSHLKTITEKGELDNAGTEV